ncbi:MAG: acetyl-CoA C-acetyltransferase, partial [Elioraea sp.]|nr:acetyl-CoA C-acetyltransferase [Elioraea sp.]
DGLQNAYDRQAMGVFAESCVARYAMTREEQDAFAAESVRRALEAQKSGAFAREIAPVTVKGRKGEAVVELDEEPGRMDIAKIPTLRPAFRKDGTVTAATSSKISDGAAAVVLMPESEAQRRGIAPKARILAHATQSQEPEWFTVAPVGALRRLLDRLGWSVADVDLFEINEA